MSRYLGVDFGTKRIGLAIGDAESGIASPVDMIACRSSMDENARGILQIAREYGTDQIVIGLPINMDGSDSAQSRFSKELAAAIQRSAPTIKVLLHDERLTSFEADQQLGGRELTRKKKKARQDALAAAVMLRSFLEQLGS